MLPPHLQNELGILHQALAHGVLRYLALVTFPAVSPATPHVRRISERCFALPLGLGSRVPSVRSGHILSVRRTQPGGLLVFPGLFIKVTCSPRLSLSLSPRHICLLYLENSEVRLNQPFPCHAVLWIIV